MSNKLGGRQGTAYLGTNANQPPNMNYNDRDPNQYDSQNYAVGDIWLNTASEESFQLVSLQGDETSFGQLAVWATISDNSGLNTLNADTGSAVVSVGAITIAGGTNINTSATASTLTVNLDDSIAVSGSITAGTTVTAGTGLTVSSLGAGVVQTNSSGVFSSSNGNDGELLIGGGSAPVWNDLDSAGGTIVVINGPNSINIEAIGTGNAVSISGDTGGPQVSGVFEFTGGTTGLTFAGAADTFTLGGTLSANNGGTGLSAITAHNLLIGSETGTLTLLAPSATPGIPLISQGSSANPAYGTAVVAGGGTGATTLTNHGVLVGQGTSPIVALVVGTNGQTLVGSTGLDPVFSTLTSSSLSYTNGAGTLAINITAPISIANGGTNATSMTNTNGVSYFDGTSLVTTGVGTAAQVLTSNGAGVAPTFQSFPGTGSGSIVQEQRVTSFSHLSSTKQVSPSVVPTQGAMQFMDSLSITPTNALNILIFQCDIPIATNGDGQIIITLFEGTTAISTVTNRSSSTMRSPLLYYQQVAGGTSPITFSLYFARVNTSSQASSYINYNPFIGVTYGGTLSYTFTITEVRP